jgi:4-hydroxythreonine-4-phosphate dehydrogenase
MDSVSPRPIAITTGEPAGIGPDICLMLAHQALKENWHTDFILIGDIHALDDRAKALQLTIPLTTFDHNSPNNIKNPKSAPCIRVHHLPTIQMVQAGQLNPANANYVLNTLDHAIQACQAGLCSAIVTAPIHKSVIIEAGHHSFTGHTEYLAQKTNTADVVMMLTGGGLRVALATTHLPLSQVSSSLTKANLERTITILAHDLQRFFGCANPRILVAGINPHAGESGHLGQEETQFISPVLEKLRQKGLHLTGPLPADTLFTPKYLNNADAVLVMYHDQGLPVVKYASFGQGVNITLGLPLIRTSVDHGTALELAGSGKAQHHSLFAAYQQAHNMVLSAKKN